MEALSLKDALRVSAFLAPTFVEFFIFFILFVLLLGAKNLAQIMKGCWAFVLLNLQFFFFFLAYWMLKNKLIIWTSLVGD